MVTIENEVFLKHCIEDAREAVYAYTMHDSQYQLYRILDAVEEKLNSFIDASRTQSIEALFEKYPARPRKLSKHVPKHYFKYYFFQHAESLDEFLFSVHFILARLNASFYAVDKAIVHWEKTNELLESCTSSYIGRFIRNFGVHPLNIAVFGNLKMERELRMVIQINSAIRNRFEKDWEPVEEFDEMYNPFLLKELKRTWHDDEWVYKKLFGRRFRFTNFKSVENAYRLGLTNKNKYLHWKKKNENEDKQKLAKDKFFQEIHRFADQIGFTKNITEYNLDAQLSTPKIVCPPKISQDRFDLLMFEQKHEYIEIFEKKQKLSRYLEYGIVRTNEILLALIRKYDQIDFDSLNAEIIFFVELFLNFENIHLSIHHGKEFSVLLTHYSLLSEFIWHLKTLQRDSRNKKLKFLREHDTISLEEIHEVHSNFYFDIVESVEAGIEIIQLDKPTLSEELQVSLRIKVSDDYNQLAITDIHYLNEYKESFTSKDELELSKKNDKKKYEKFKKTNLALSYQNSIKNSKNISLEKMVEISENYLSDLIDIGKDFHPANMSLLELDKVIPKLISQLVKLKKWNQILYWGNVYFDISSNLRYSMIQKKEDALRKQMKRAKKKIGKL